LRSCVVPFYPISSEILGMTYGLVLFKWILDPDEPVFSVN
jgi:hypothetical protein